MTKKTKRNLGKPSRNELGLGYNDVLISQKIRTIRKAANLTQEELAQRINTTKSAVSRYESNKYNRYSIFLLEKIALACDVDLQVSFIKVDLNKKKLIRI